MTAPNGVAMEILGRLGSLEHRLSALVPDRAPAPVAEAVTEDWQSFIFNVVLTAGGTGVTTQLNDATGHFDLVFITAVSTVTDHDLPSFNVRVREGEQGKFLTSNGNFIDWRNWTGTAQRPYFLKGRRRFRANTTMIIEFQETSGAPNTIQVALHGIKVSV